MIRNKLHQYIYCAEMCLKIFKFMETLTTSLGSLSHYSSIQIILTINVRCQRNRIKIQTLVSTKPETASSALRLSVTFKTTHRTGSLPKNTLNSPSQVQYLVLYQWCRLVRGGKRNYQQSYVLNLNDGMNTTITSKTMYAI